MADRSALELATLGRMERSWVDRVADDLAASRAELAGLAVLLVGGIVLAVVVVGRVPVVSAPGSPAGSPGAVGELAAVAEDGAATPVLPSAAPSPTPPPVVVHVTGAVRAPTVVTLAAGARLVDAIDAAGGAGEDAALDVLNLAQVLGDGQRLHVPTLDEVAEAEAAVDVQDPGVATGATPDWGPDPATPGAATTPGAAPGTSTADGLLDLNLATVAELEELPGVGPVLAGRIVAWRDDNGGFTEVGQLRDVTGIGEARFQDLVALVDVP